MSVSEQHQPSAAVMQVCSTMKSQSTFKHDCVVCWQGFQNAVTDLVVNLITKPCDLRANYDSYIHGYPQDRMQENLPALLARLLTVLMNMGMTLEHKRYFVQHAFVPCTENFVEGAQQLMQQFLIKNTSLKSFAAPQAYVLMLGMMYKLSCVLWQLHGRLMHHAAITSACDQA